MGLSSKFLLFLIVCVAFQTINAWPQFNIFKWRNLGYEINRAADDAERDVRKDLLNVKNKAWKETSKMLRKGGSNEAFLSCIMQTHQEILTKMDKSSVDAVACIEAVRSRVATIDDRELSPREMSGLKNQFKGEVKSCRNTSKYELKGCQVEFSSKAHQCFIMQNKPPQDNPSQSYPPQENPSQSYPPQGYPPMGNPPQGLQ